MKIYNEFGKKMNEVQVEVLQTISAWSLSEVQPNQLERKSSERVRHDITFLWIMSYKESLSIINSITISIVSKYVQMIYVTGSAVLPGDNQHRISSLELATYKLICA